MWEKTLSGERGNERLADRRLRHNRRMFVFFGILFVIFFTALIYGLWQSPVRVTHIVIYGADQSLAAFATSAMQGSYFGIPRDSIFFVPESAIRSRIMAVDQNIAAVSIFRNGLSGLSIKVDYRVPIARWCGDPSALSMASSTQSTLTESQCYFFDANGFLYAAASSATAVNTFMVYESLASNNVASAVSASALSTSTPIGTTLPNAKTFPSVFDFARQLSLFGSPVDKIVIQPDQEIDFFCKSGTRVTYMLGNEQNAYTALSSASSRINIAKGSIDYVDLRFPGKIYVKSK
jgi:hypothetical protein